MSHSKNKFLYKYFSVGVFISAIAANWDSVTKRRFSLLQLNSFPRVIFRHRNLSFLSQHLHRTRNLADKVASALYVVCWSCRPILSWGRRKKWALFRWRSSHWGRKSRRLSASRRTSIPRTESIEGSVSEPRRLLGSTVGERRKAYG